MTFNIGTIIINYYNIYFLSFAIVLMAAQQSVPEIIESARFIYNLPLRYVVPAGGK